MRTNTFVSSTIFLVNSKYKKNEIFSFQIDIFSLISDAKGSVNHRKLGILLYDMIMIPKQLGEVAAFGGSNIEPSVKSCFEHVNFEFSSFFILMLFYSF